MMKRKILAAVIPALLAAATANAAEIYNKDGNKLDLYGKAVGRPYGQRPAIVKMPTRLMPRLVLKGKRRLTPI